VLTGAELAFLLHGVDLASVPGARARYQSKDLHHPESRRRSRDSWANGLLPHQEANFQRVLGVLFYDMSLDTQLREDLSIDRLMVTTADKPTFFDASC
jgi:hypothetical protein